MKKLTALFSFLALVTVLFFSSCTTHRGYSAHVRKNKRSFHQAFDGGSGGFGAGNMTNWKPNKRETCRSAW